MFQVGFCYYHGIRVEIDKHQAFEHYRKLTEIGSNSNGIFKTAICYYYGIGVEE